jgi:hypothetical protein
MAQRRPIYSSVWCTTEVRLVLSALHINHTLTPSNNAQDSSRAKALGLGRVQAVAFNDEDQQVTTSVT